MKIANLALVAVLGVGMTAAAQSSSTDSAGTQGSQTGSSSQSSKTKESAAKNSDMVFAKSAAAGGLAEVQGGQLALKNAQSDQVKQFAQKMIDDHTKANDDLKQVAEKNNLTLPTEPTAKDQAEMKKLEGLQGAAFDKAYMAHMVKDHTKDSKEFHKEADTGKNQDLKDFAQKYASVIDQHLQLAKDVNSQVGGKAGKTSKPSPSGSGQ
jgi:putative membrane protein